MITETHPRIANNWQQIRDQFSLTISLFFSPPRAPPPLPSPAPSPFPPLPHLLQTNPEVTPSWKAVRMAVQRVPLFPLYPIWCRPINWPAVVLIELAATMSVGAAIRHQGQYRLCVATTLSWTSVESSSLR